MLFRILICPEVFDTTRWIAQKPLRGEYVDLIEPNSSHRRMPQF